MNSTDPNPTSLLQKILLVFASLLVAVLLVEIGLRAGSLVYRWTDGPDEISPAIAAPNEYRILALGESTTRGFGHEPYTRSLEEELNRREYGIRFRVLNAGYTSKPSPALVRQLPELLERVDPHMVIVMMGINDQFYFQGAAAPRLGLDVELLLLESRFYKLLRLLGFNLRQRLRSAFAGPSEPKEFQSSFESAHEDWSAGELEQADVRFLEFIREAREAGETGDSGATISIPDAYLRAYFNAHLTLAQIYRETDRSDKAIALFEEAIALHPEAEFFHRALSGIYHGLGENERAAAYLEVSEELAARHVLYATRFAFRQLRKILEDAKVEVVMMQYPLRSVAALQRLWGPSRGVLFLNNQPLFRQAVSEYGYDAIFIDRFAGDFGHCTIVGNRIIALNLVLSVFEPRFGANRVESPSR